MRKFWTIFAVMSLSVTGICAQAVTDGKSWQTQFVDFDGLVRQKLAALAPGVSFDIFRIDEAPMVGAVVAATGCLEKGAKTC